MRIPLGSRGKIGSGVLFALALSICAAGKTRASCDAGDFKSDAVANIEQKFNLKATTTQRGCGGAEIAFHYRPPENLVPENSFFASWNTSFTLGVVSGESSEQVAGVLQSLLALDKNRMDAVKLANAHYIQDLYETENVYGFRASDPYALSIGERFSNKGQLMYVTAPHCEPKTRRSTSDEYAGEVYLPVTDLAAAASLLNRGVPLYEKGDLLKTVRADTAVRTKLKQIANDNLSALDDPTCRRGMEPNSVVYWNKLLAL